MATFIKGDGRPRIIRAGNIVVDKYGLATASVVWWGYSRAEIVESGVASIGSGHPTAAGLSCEKIVYSDSDGGATLEASYAGIYGVSPSPVDELDSTLTDAPIEAHPNFADFAGTPDTPLNGAVFVRDSEGNFRFDRFGVDAPAGFRGMTSFEVPTSISRRTTISRSAPSVGALGTRTAPPETFGVSGDWLLWSVNSQKRGSVYVTRQEWKASGPLGWNDSVYS